ncbi:MAG: hypothetical protein COW24_00570 [Candidatus Kerfeldbacteria bacterium CG15_BIG_FIL_POST_REV_8_21_14_020_45_12]|uniref:EamA domain-containing protein n=1 Tax=Candidatus Kerfeldbacteria bacterium CG15_BIG_FIL_POST_REV_8_21_14_020_45_12 TaxID=2014247 RepID=A0A2M7H554_9BACT|nr:MAG: hypothetical protein COW24_00570 [Candidatus Kerfeldbacteria bacterium CG15_BIG_FIL_POST_REV_8_21_14_020_45_12]PJA94086.1 MAG: hypothetical protein CO132_00110 [Candidatus Kerfeldbacteria bacterium CG_4_9_14_3_um_filter_45_8]
MSWLLAVLIGHLLNAVSFVLDKVLLTKSIQNAYAFTFFIGLLGLAALGLAPFGATFLGIPGFNVIAFDFTIPTAGSLLLNLIVGALFTLALLCFFLAMRGQEATRLVPFVGGSVPVFTFVFEWLFLDQRLSITQLVAFGVLVIGTILITLDLDKKAEPDKPAQGAKGWVLALLAGLFFALSFGLTKIAFEQQNFYNAFIWMRLGSFLLPLLFLLSAKHRIAIYQAFSLFREKAGFLYLVAQGFGGAGFIFINYAISIASVSIVNALQGVQYAFLLLMAIIGSLKYPKLLKESMSRRSLALKVFAVMVIGFGLYLIAQSQVYA